MSTVFSACADKENGSNESVDGSSADTSIDLSTEEESSSTAAGAYNISVKTAGGMPLSEIDVYIYSDDSLSDLVQFEKTDANGKAVLSLTKSEKYAVVLSGVPKGYDLADSYGFAGNVCDITLTSSLISEGSLSDATLGVGDVMYDFTVVDSNGSSVTLSDVLKDRELVVLNFWYTTCSWCLTEFPIMDEAYQSYKDDVAILALDPMDAEAVVEAFHKEYGYSFIMAACQSSWANTFGVTGYPTSVFIDRYGVICLVESGAITSMRPFLSVFDHFTGDDYEQKLCESIGDLVSDVLPTETMASSEEIAAILNKGDVSVTYRPETEGDNWEYSWPFIVGEKNGVDCLYASNREIESSYAILYADVTLKAGQAVGFDYLVSSEALCDILYVLVDGKDIYQISGVYDTEEWKSCYPWVALEDGTYEIAFCYLKDDSTNEGDDTVYIKDFRAVDKSEIDAATYIPCDAAVSKDGINFTYADIRYNEQDGYYHVGSVNGPLLLADLMNITQFNEERTVYDIAYSGELVVDGHNYYDDLVDYCSYASNSSLSGVCTVNYELAELLKIVGDIAGFYDDENEWLKICKYYQVYGEGTAQLTDPIEGLATFSAPEAVFGLNIDSNYFYYDRAIIPRGMFKEFIPDKSGVYRITSRNDSVDGVEAWLFNEKREIIYTYEHCERLFEGDGECSIVYYMEAGTPYYINIAFWDIYQTGYIYFDIEYLGSTFDYFRLCSPGFFTYDSDATGNDMYYVISGGTDVILKDDGFYYADLGLDENGDQIYGSMIYADFTGLTPIFDKPISGYTIYDSDGNPIETNGIIEMGGFNFSMTEDDEYIKAFLDKRDGNIDTTDEYLREYWGDRYDEFAELYQIEDVYEGRFHGKGEDYTEVAKTYAEKIITSGKEELKGCVPVSEELAEVLQMLMDKYTFDEVDNSWTKLCYYYQYLGA